MQAAVPHVEAIRGQIVEYLTDLVRIPMAPPPGSDDADLCLYAMERARQMDGEVDLVHVPQTYEHTLYPFGTGHPRMSLQAALTLLS